MSTPVKFQPLKGTKLFEPIRFGSHVLSNRLVFVPTSRKRGAPGFYPSNLQVNYYKDRAVDGGLTVVESTFTNVESGAMKSYPSILSDKHAEGYKKIAGAIHSKGGVASIQLHQLGRTGSPSVAKELGLPFLGVSTKYVSEASEKEAKLVGNNIKMMTTEEVKIQQDKYIEACKRAIKISGFDFVEIHCTSGFLIDQFIQPTINNERTDQYAGSIENRSRYFLEILDRLIEEIGANKIGIRIGPWSTYQGSAGINMKPSPLVSYGYILSELENRKEEGNEIAYVSIVEPRVSGNADVAEGFNIEDANNYPWVFQLWKGTVIRAGGYLTNGFGNLLKDISLNDRTLVGVGRYFTSNPDLVKRLFKGLELTSYNRATFYTHDDEGYNTWKQYEEKENRKPQPLLPAI